MKKIIKYLKNKYQKINNWLNHKKIRKKNIILITILFIVGVLFINIYSSNAYYHEESGFPLIHSVVGNMYLQEYDYVEFIYLENVNNNGVGNGTYRIADSIPAYGYTYNGYNCQNNSQLVYDENTHTTSVTITGKESCSVYFNVANTSDINLRVMIEKDVNSNNYIENNTIPAYGYRFDHYNCVNNSTLSYDSLLNKVRIEAIKKDTCTIYLKKEQADITLNLYIEKTYHSGNYQIKSFIPQNHNYRLNSTNTKCVDKNNERINIVPTYENGYLKLETNKISYCDVYLDLENE